MPFDDPIRTFEHTHGNLTASVLRVGAQLRGRDGRAGATTGAQRQEVLGLLEPLRDELLQHFADEEEGLFPFVRRTVPSMAPAVERLEASHDAICGAVVRLAHLAAHEGDHPLLLAVFERFEKTYAEHSREEGNLFEDLGRQLEEPARSELAALLRGLSTRP